MKHETKMPVLTRHMLDPFAVFLQIAAALRYALGLLILTSVANVVMGQESQTDGQQELQDRLKVLQRQMQHVGQQLVDRPPNAQDLDTQNAITTELAGLIRQFSASQQPRNQPGQSSRRSASSQKERARSSGVAAESPADNDGGTRETEPDDAREVVLDAWGHMPGQLRERNGDVSPRFLPRFERLIREYYRRIAQ